MNTIFTNQNTAHLVELFFWMLGAFLLGWTLARLFAPKNEKIVVKEVMVDKIIYKEREVSDTIHPALDNSTPVSTNTIIESHTTDKSSSPSSSAAITKASTLNFSGFGRASETDKNDLKRISGIGPSLEKKLNTIGIFTYQQISKFSYKDMADITELITFFPGRIERDNWVLQAKNLVKGTGTDFSKRVDKGDVYENKIKKSNQ